MKSKFKLRPIHIVVILFGLASCGPKFDEKACERMCHSLHGTEMTGFDYASHGASGKCQCFTKTDCNPKNKTKK